MASTRPQHVKGCLLAGAVESGGPPARFDPDTVEVRSGVQTLRPPVGGGWGLENLLWPQNTCT
jgi:hypothetical protein